MKTHTPTKLLVATAMVALTQPLHAQLPVSATASITSYDLVANTSRIFSVPVTRQPVVRGVVTAQTGSTVTIEGASGLNSLSGNHTLVIAKGGDLEGRAYPITGFPSGNQATATGLPTLSITNKDEVVVIPNFTLDTLFPSGGGFKTGPNPGAADIVTIIVGGAARPFYFQSTSSQWRSADNPSDSANKGSTTLEFRGSVLVKGASTSPGKLIFAGVHPSGDVRAQYNSPVFRSIAFPYGEAGTLVNLIPADKITTGPNPGAADIFYVVVSGAIRPFYYNSSSAYWRAADNPSDTGNKNSTVINAGDGIFVKPVGSTLRTLDFQQNF